MLILAHRTSAYGQWRVVVQTKDGAQFEGWGLTEQQATYRAQCKARAARGDKTR